MHHLSKVLLVDQNFTGSLVYRVELYKFYLLYHLRNKFFLSKPSISGLGSHLLKLEEQVSVILGAWSVGRHLMAVSEGN